MFAIGNEELARNDDVGESVHCPHCGLKHPVEYGEEILKDGTKVKSDTLAFYKCGDNSYLYGIAGKRI